MRKVPVTRMILIERDDFLEDPPNKFFRLRPGGEVRLRNAFIIRCDEVVKDADGCVVELLCGIDPESRRGKLGADRKVKGTLHWVSADLAVTAEVRLYNRLFTVLDPGADKERDFVSFVNPRSVEVISGAKLEPCLASAEIGDHYQFERLGYFTPDTVSSPGRLVFNRSVTLRV